MLKAYIKRVCTAWQALSVGGESWVECCWEALTSDLVHQIPGEDGGVVLVQGASVGVLHEETLVSERHVETNTHMTSHQRGHTSRICTCRVYHCLDETILHAAV